MVIEEDYHLLILLLILLIISISGIIYYSIYHKGNVSSDYGVNVESTDEYKVYYYNQISEGATKLCNYFE